MKRIKLYAYWNRNLGDDLMVALLLARYPGYRFFSPNWKPGPEMANFENRETLQRRFGRINHLLNILTVYRKKDFFLQAVERWYERSCICSVYIGGSLYMQDGDAAERLSREEEKMGSGPLFVLGANFGPCRDEAFREGFADYFSRCGGVTFRDRASFGEFRHCGRITYAPDVVLNLKAVPEPADGTVLISVIDLTHRPELATWQERYERFVVRLCKACIRQGKRPVLLSFCEGEGDGRAVSRILQTLGPDRPAEALFYRGDTAPILRTFARAERIIATRFHAMILAMCYKKPLFALCYSEKMTHVLEDLEFSGFCRIPELPEHSPEELLNRCTLPQGLDAYKQAAQEQFIQLDDFLQEAGTW